MPLLEITTNTTITNQHDIAQHASKFAAEMLGKPESYVMVKINADQPITFAGNFEPAAHVKLKSLGLPENNTADYSASLCNFINNNLGIDSGRIYIEFSNPERHMWGWNGKTF